MSIYIIILIIVYLISFINPRKITKLDIIFFLILAGISGFRYDVGTDYFEYVRYFNLIETGNIVPAEPGFIFLSKIISNLNLNSQALFFTLSVLTMIFLYKGLQYYTNNGYTYKPLLYLIMLIFVFIPSLNVVRQILAATIMLYASKYIFKKQFIQFVIWVIFASLFHYSSIIFLFLYFISLKNFKRSYLIIILFSSVLLSNLGIITMLLEFILLHFNFLDIGGYIENYLYSSYNKREVDYGVVFYIHVFVLLVFIILKDKLINDDTALLSFNFFYFYIISYLLSMDASMLTRLTYFFSIYMAISISRFGIIFDDKSKIIVEYSVMGLYTLLFIYVILNGYFVPEQSDFIPYNYNFDFKK